jgi:putative endonuclease
MESIWYVYCLESSQGATYVGATTDPYRRLRQHSGLLSGGARYTTGRVSRGETWRLHCFVGPFGKKEALQFEWRWKWYSKKESGTPLQRREKAVQNLLDFKENLSIHFPDLEQTDADSSPPAESQKGLQTFQ